MSSIIRIVSATIFIKLTEPGDEYVIEEPVEYGYEDQAYVNSENFADAGVDDAIPGDATELKWEFDEDSGRYYVSFPDDQ